MTIQKKQAYKRRFITRVILQSILISALTTAILIIFSRGDFNLKFYAGAGLYILLYAECMGLCENGMNHIREVSAGRPRRLPFQIICICLPIYLSMFVVALMR